MCAESKSYEVIEASTEISKKRLESQEMCIRADFLQRACEKVKLKLK
jgi:hypothetical protein